MTKDLEKISKLYIFIETDVQLRRETPSEELAKDIIKYMFDSGLIKDEVIEKYGNNLDVILEDSKEYLSKYYH